MYNSREIYISLFLLELTKFEFFNSKANDRISKTSFNNKKIFGLVCNVYLLNKLIFRFCEISSIEYIFSHITVVNKGISVNISEINIFFMIEINT